MFRSALFAPLVVCRRVRVSVSLLLLWRHRVLLLLLFLLAAQSEAVAAAPGAAVAIVILIVSDEVRLVALAVARLLQGRVAIAILSFWLICSFVARRQTPLTFTTAL
jgi:hypothetical protein